MMKMNDLDRRLLSSVRHLFLMAKVIGIAIILTFVWVYLRDSGYHFNKEDELVAFCVCGIFGGLYGFVYNALLTITLAKYRDIVKSVLEGDRRTFLFFRDEKLPIIAHLTLVVLSILVLGIIMMFNFKNHWIGLWLNFSACLGFVMSEVFLLKLDDPIKAAWLRDRIPKEWLTAIIDKVFQLNPQIKQVEELPAIPQELVPGK